MVTQLANEPPAVGLYFHEAKFGLLLSPNDAPTPISIANVTSKEFIRRVQDDWHLTLSGPELQTTPAVNCLGSGLKL